jgi:iron complex outermembrane receptor protein
MTISTITLRAAMLASVVLPLGALPAPGLAQLPGHIPGEADSATDYDLPAQALGDRLRAISRLSGREIIFVADAVEGHWTTPLRGRFTVAEALRSALADTDLTVEHMSGAIIVRARPAPHTDDGSAALWATGDADETIVVTGTNLRGGTPTSQVITITREEIDQSGSASAEQLLRQLPQNFQGGVNQENFRVVGAGADPTENGAGINLRGLGQRATLVLVNSRRLAPSGAGSFVDISLIPLSAVERVEILTDGASAIYGSDAVGGVVNFILRDRFEGIEALVRAGTATRGDGDQLQLGATAGANWVGGRAMLSYEFRAEDEIAARDRDFTINLAPDTSLFPRERRHSLFATINQDLGERLTIALSGLASRRNSDRSYFFLNTPLPAFVRAEASTMSLDASVDYDLGGGWRAQLQGGFAQSDTDQEQRQPGATLELINLFEARSEMLDVGVKLDGVLFSLPGGPLRLAFGAQNRFESYKDLFGTGTLQPTRRQRDRNVRALFGELQLPILSSANRRAGLERLVLTTALRLEDYQGIGSTLDPKAGILWSPLPGLSFRASYDTSFRAPLLSESAGAYNAFYFPVSLVSVVPTSSDEVALVLAGSNPDVRPERSRTWTAGAELRPPRLPELTLSVNYYSIRFDNRIALPAPTVAVVGDPAFEAIVARNPDIGRVMDLVAGAVLIRDVSGPGFTDGGATPADVDLIVDGRVGNTALTSTQGFDITLRHGLTLADGRLSTDLNLNYILDFEEQLNASSPRLQALNRPYRPVDLRIRAGAAWTRAGWTTNLALHYVGDYVDDRAPAVRSVGSFVTLDAGIAYHFEQGPLAGTRVALNVQNLFDTDPPLLLPDPGSTTGLGYDPVNATGRGRMVALQLRSRW